MLDSRHVAAAAQREALAGLRNLMDTRERAAEYYDLNPESPSDIPFYIARLSSPNVRVLELGCGTGRVLVPLSASCEYIHGIDKSEAMLRICRRKLADHNVSPNRANVQLGDITDFDLGCTFDMVVAPYRVLQNLETDHQLAGLFTCIRRHLAPDGTCVLNVFNPNRSREAMKVEWCRTEETLEWQVRRDSRRFTCHDIRPRLNPEKMILYPELIYRTHESSELIDEVVLPIAMRCYYPDEFDALIRNHGFAATNRWGGYRGETYGEGPELVIECQPTG